MSRQYIACRFSLGGTDYTYHNDGEPVEAGDQVIVTGRGGNGTRTVTVTAAVPKPEFVTKAIIGKAAPAAPDEGKLL